MRTLLIRNEPGGIVWQCHHTANPAETAMLTRVALANGFQSVELRQYDEDQEETFPDWRDTPVWKERWQDESPKYDQSPY